ncbi:putative RNA-dependent RNA polymerase 1 [Artemisia annua]|uniref:RNA-dependent RNA polymerase n=1 Tax=Artemisia annua TaxID=35608 RepID=A0A2U1MJ66_ARTAN|nr:putative RNA-dependent RNA polymerase 1 [Artemisia annua]
MYFCGLEVNLLNRVLHRYAQHADRFMRVSFIDEVFENLYHSNLCTRSEGLETSTLFYERTLDILKNVIFVGKKKNWMGNFNKIKVLAKYASRLGLSFGASIESLFVSDDELELINDIEEMNTSSHIESRKYLPHLQLKFLGNVEDTVASKSFGPGEAYDRDMEAEGYKDHIEEKLY